MRIADLYMQKPAILLGNGLNNYLGLPISWKKLLCSLAQMPNAEGMLESRGITYPEFYDAICLRDGQPIDRYVTLKPRIANLIKEWRGGIKHFRIVDYAKRHSIPILTTNYDTTLLSDDFLSEMRKVSKRPRAEMYGPLRIEGSTFTDFYPWHSYYSTQKVGQANSDFALWQIHGFWFYKRSLVIGSMDYASAIHRLREWIYETSNRKRTIGTENWIGAKSWVDIFLHNDLVIIGLSLGSQETSLRWLLIEREKYFRNFPERRRKTVYCINGERDEAWDAGKAFYFQSICVDCRVIKSGKELYEIWE